MSKYHIRRKDKEITDRGEIEKILASARFITVAMCSRAEPYLVNLNHGFDSQRGCLYFHCADEGKKIDFLRKNPRVWGQAIEDLGYADGRCDHQFRSVMFSGEVKFLEQLEEKSHALRIMIEQQESEPQASVSRLLKPERIAGCTVGRIDIDFISGKENLIL